MGLNRSQRKHRKRTIKKMSQDIGNKGFFVTMKVKVMDKKIIYYIHPDGDSYKFVSEIVGAAVFSKEIAQMYANAQHGDCEVLSVNEATGGGSIKLDKTV